MAWPFSRASICSCVKLVLFLCSFLLSCSLSWDSSASSLSTGTPPTWPVPVPRASPPMLPSVSSRQPSDTDREEGDIWDGLGWFRQIGSWYYHQSGPHSVHSPVLCCVWTPVGSWYQLLCPLQFAPLCRFSMVNFSYILRAPKPPWREVKESRPVRVYFWWLPPLAPHLSFYSPKRPPRGWVGELGRCARRGEGEVHIAWVHTWLALWWISLTMTDRNGVSYMPAVAMCVCYTLVC